MQSSKMEGIIRNENAAATFEPILYASVTGFFQMFFRIIIGQNGLIAAIASWFGA